MALDHLLPGQTQALIPEGPLPTEFESRALFKGEDLEVMVLLVPEGRHEVTTEGGLDILAQEAALKDAITRLSDAGIMSSVFIDADLAQVEAAARIGARVCEIHTGPYAHAFHNKGRDAESPAVLAEIDQASGGKTLWRTLTE